MSHRFKLTPDLQLLTSCGYLEPSVAKDIQSELDAVNSLTINLDAVHATTQREEIEVRFKDLVDRYNLTEYYETLLFVCCVESNHADLNFQHVHQNYQNRLRDKQLAQFLLLFKPNAKYPAINLKISTLTETVKITNPDLITLFGSLMTQFLEQGDFIPGIHGTSLFQFIANDTGSIDANSEFKLNYAVIDALASRSVRKPGIRDRNRTLAAFLLIVWNVLDKATPLTTIEGIRFSDNQLKFLFEVAEIFEWLRDIDIHSDSKDYIYTLLLNEIKRK
jgi:hypothetical protein